MPHELELLRELQHHLQHEIKRLEHEKVLCTVNLNAVDDEIYKWIQKNEGEKYV